MFRTQPIPPDYLPPEDAEPHIFYALPELRYPTTLNVAEALVDGALAKGWGARTAYFYEGQRITFDAVARGTNRAANGLRSLGIGLGDRVMVRMTDRPEAVYALLAIMRIGAIAMPTYPMLSADELVYRANDAEAVAIICDADLLPAVEQARPRCPALRHVLVPGESYDELLRGQPDECPAAPTGRDDVSILMYTSGTTGEPKGVIQPHVDHLSSGDCHMNHVLHLTADDVLAGPVALPFRFGIEFYVIFTLRNGCPSVLLPRKTPAAVLDAVQRYGVTVMGGVPTFYNMALQELATTKYDLSSLRLCVCAGEPMPLPVFERWKAATGLPLTQMLGTTELSWFLGYRGPAGLKPETLGMATPGCSVVVRDPETFQELPPGEQGIMTVAGPSGARYWRKPEQQRHAIRNGWTVVPDIVSMDEDGYVRYVGRADEMIVSAGYNIAPVQVEQALSRHPAVAEAACVGAPDPEGIRSAIVKAYVVLRDGFEPSKVLEAELQCIVRQQATPYMYPRQIEFLDALPKTFNGKVRRTELKQRAWATVRG
ncbi:MAG TPA: acyl-CoA synthetase [Chloroflexota bacterium]|nr:acyl-CoA synthetase [Chloroflexota bacterium]